MNSVLWRPRAGLASLALWVVFLRRPRRVDVLRRSQRVREGAEQIALFAAVTLQTLAPRAKSAENAHGAVLAGNEQVLALLQFLHGGQLEKIQQPRRHAL